MKQEPDGARPKLRFTPKIPQRKIPKAVIPKQEPSAVNDDVINKELLAKIERAKSNDAFGRRFFKNEKKEAPSEVVFGDVTSTMARSFHRVPPKSKDGLDPSMQKEFEEPWDYANEYFPATLPARRPYSGDRDILDKAEFRASSTGTSLKYSKENTAEELGLVARMQEPQLIFFQLPAYLPMTKKSNPVDAAGQADKIPNKGCNKPDKGCKLEDLPAGFMGKMLVYKSGMVKMKIGDVLFDVTTGPKSTFAQDVANFDTKGEQCCVLGQLDKRAVVIPDIDSMLADY